MNLQSITSKLPDLKTTIFTVIGGLAREHNATDLSQGFPNFPVNPYLIELVNKAMKDGHNQYGAMQGHFGLCEAISEKIEKLHGRRYNPEKEITITVGATQAIFTTISAFIHSGDEVIVLKPAYDCYEPIIELNNGIPICIQLDAPGYKIDWKMFKSKITPKTKMVVINSPHNPTGFVFSKDDMLQLQEILRNTNILLLSDEVYEHIIFDDEQHYSASQFDDLASRSFVCASFGKTFHATGWRMGYCVAPAELMSEFRKIHQYAVFSIDHPRQVAMASYLKEESHYLQLNSFFQQKRDFFLEAIKDSHFCFTPSKGTYFQLLDYAAITDESDTDFAERLIIDHKLASIPISSFNVNNKDDQMLRFCFAKTNETLEKAAEILNKF